MRQPARLAAAIRHFHPAMRTRPQPPVLACGRAALAPGAVAASAPHPTTLNAVVTFSYAAAYSACRSHSASPSRHASAAPAHRASLRQSRASTRGCCRVRPHPTTLNAVVTFFYAAACSACRSHSAFPSRHESAAPAPTARLRLRHARARGCCRVRPHPTTLKTDVTFFYAAACSACRRQRWFVLSPCWRVTSKLRLDVVIIFASSAALWLARRYALAIRNAAAGALRPFGHVT